MENIKQPRIKRINMRSLRDLKKVLVCSPDNFRIIKPINYTEEETFKEGISLSKLKKEHKEFCELLALNKVKPIYVPLLDNCPQQTFTRDTGFVFENKFFLAQSSINMRKDETLAIKEILNKEAECYQFKNNLEGGDVIIFKKNIFVGISSRTSQAAVDELKQQLPMCNVIPIRLKKHILHLDTVLNYVGNIAVFYKEGIKDDFEIEKYFKKVIYVKKEQQRNLPTNFLSLSKNKIIASKKNFVVNQELTNYGIEVIEGGFNEMLKLGGSYRCCSLGIVQE